MASDTFTCPACHMERNLSEQTHRAYVPPVVTAAIEHRHPHWRVDQTVCRACVNEGKADGMQVMLEADMGALEAAERAVLDSIRENSFLSTDAEDEFERGQRASERLAHRVVRLVGSWPFAVGILMFIATWLLVNLLGRPFEPYPIIVLSILGAVLASLAGLQGPIIVMSQRYQRDRDRLRSLHEYQINLKAELEIQYISDQLEHVLERQRKILDTLSEIQIAHSLRPPGDPEGGDGAFD